ETRGRSADLRQVERGDHFVGTEYFLLAVAPAEPHQVVAQCNGQVAHGAVGIDPERAVTLGQFRTVRPVDERYVRHRRHVPAERVVDVFLPRAIGEMIVAADDVRDVYVRFGDH